MCEPGSLAAFFSSLGGASGAGATGATATGATVGTSAGAAASTATGIASGAVVPTTVTSIVPGTATGLAGTALAPAAGGVSGGVAAGGLSGVAKAALALGPSLVAPLLFKPSMPKIPTPATSDPTNSAAKARMAARLKLAGAYGKAATDLTGGSGVAAPTSGQKLTLGA